MFAIFLVIGVVAGASYISPILGGIVFVIAALGVIAASGD